MNSLVLELTDKCNLKCKYCYYGDRNDKNMVIKQEVVDELVSFMRRDNGNDSNANHFYIDFIGGEPLLSFDMMRYVVDKFKTPDIANRFKIKYRLTTNGTIIDEDIIFFLKKENISIVISLDGDRESHDACRIFNNGKGSYNEVINNLKIIEDNGIIYDVRATITKKTMAYDKLSVFFNKLNVASFGLMPAVFNDNKNIEYQLDEVDVKELGKNMLKEFEQNIMSGIISKNSVLLNIFSKIIFDKKSLYPCNAGITYFGIGSDGYIYPCHRFFGLREYSIGHVSKNIDYDKLSNIAGISVDKRVTCSNCDIRYYCGGTCYYESLVKMHDISSIEHLTCVLSQVLIKGVIKIIINLQRLDKNLLMNIITDLNISPDGESNKKIDKLEFSVIKMTEDIYVDKNNITDKVYIKSAGVYSIDLEDEGIIYKIDTTDKIIANLSAMVIFDLIDSINTAKKIVEIVASISDKRFVDLEDDIYRQLIIFQHLGYIEEVNNVEKANT